MSQEETPLPLIKFFNMRRSFFLYGLTFFLLLVLLLPSCKSSEIIEFEDSELASKPNDPGLFAGVPPKILRENAHKLRMMLIETNLAGCSIPFADQYRDLYNTHSAEELANIERDVNLLGAEMMKEERPGEPLQAMITVTSVQAALKYLDKVGQPRLDKAKDISVEVAKRLQPVDLLVEKAAQGSNAIVRFFERVSKRLGPRTALNAIKIAVPQAILVENVVRKIAEMTGKSAQVTRAAYNLATWLSAAGLGYLKAVLRYAPGVAGAYGDNLLVCNVTHSLITSLEVMELEATMDDNSITARRKAALLPRFCAALARRDPKAPLIRECKPKKF
jgi:hypothetical protein